ncbi:diguanylate cyclase domain-containing protein [Hydrogenovibrio sp. SC-1]|uniref:diguanylate cyclase domain-containing protein n=1 Tax=Hydrogenovibrio sp. SC-1 TaxID=2065820 RepID=UPI00117BC175|nr:diguanylate cyclase [Hydrogenovibrio sp. SC-1]
MNVIVLQLIKAVGLWIVCGLSCIAMASPSQLTPVKLQLKWQHQFQFAGYYAALEQGYYRDAGLDVTLVEADVGKDSIQAVINGEAEFGVGTSELVLNYSNGDPVVVLAAIMQHSPLGLATIKSNNRFNIHQLASQTMMIEPSSAELFAYFKSEGVDIDQLNLVKHSHNTQDLIDGKVQAMSIYTTDETYDFESKGIDYQLFRPIMSGIDFYGDNLFTTQDMVDRNPELVEAFRQASIKGWQYAMQHSEAMIDLIIAHYSQRKTQAHLRYEADKMRELMKPNLVEIGYFNPGRWQQISRTYVQLGLLSEKFDVSGMLYQFDQDRAYQQLKQWLYWMLMVLSVVTLIAGVVYHQYRLATIRRKQFESLFLNAPVSLMELDQSGCVVSWNREAENTFQYTAKEAIGRNAYDLIVAKDKVSTVDALIASAWKQNTMTYSENHNIRKDGKEILCRWANMPFENEHKNQKHVISMARDITSEKALEGQLYHAAHYDELTELPNRALILAQLKDALEDAKRYQSQLAVLFIDLNKFKPVNDRYGHHVGDEVLKQVALRIKQTFRKNDLVGRLSGDEFIAVVKDLKQEAYLQKVIEKVCQAIDQPIQYDALTLHTSASIGSSQYPKDAESEQALIRIADHAMYQVKSNDHSDSN